jgi:hypothetical protein
MHKIVSGPLAFSMPSVRPIDFSRRTLRRADRAVACSPFRFALFQALQQQAVPLRAIAGQQGVQNGYTRQVLSETTADDELIWLIQVGVLRREVDGQGITDRFRLTPLGSNLVEVWGKTGYPKPDWLSYARNLCSRCFHLPF